MLKIIDCVQGSEEWLRARMGIPTASRFSAVLAQSKDGTDRKTRDKYLRQLAGEILTEEPAETFKNEAMERGKDQEDGARRTYAFQSDCSVEQVGFLLDTEIGAGASPDGLIGADGMVEFKSMQADLLIEVHQKKVYPPAFRAQLQGNLWIAKRHWIDICIFHPKMAMFRQRVFRDPGYIARLVAEVAEFRADLDVVVRQIRNLS
jgi:hypothetical protein